MMLDETHSHAADVDDHPSFSRTGGIPNGDDGLPHEIKTFLPEDLFAEFLVAVKNKGGRSAVTRDLITMWLKGKTFAEHVAESRRAQLFGTGTDGRPFTARNGGAS